MLVPIFELFYEKKNIKDNTSIIARNLNIVGQCAANLCGRKQPEHKSAGKH